MPATYTLISSNVLTSSAASVTFSAIPATYTDLVLRISARLDSAQAADSMRIIINDDTNANYSITYLQGNGSAASSSRESGAGSGGRRILAPYIPAATSTSNTFGSHEIYIPNYTSTSSRPVSQFGVQETNATAALLAASANLYRGTSAISKLEIFDIGGSNFVSGSSFYLYGISSN
jgi:hypothetical protein